MWLLAVSWLRDPVLCFPLSLAHCSEFRRRLDPVASPLSRLWRHPRSSSRAWPGLRSELGQARSGPVGLRASAVRCPACGFTDVRLPPCARQQRGSPHSPAASRPPPEDETAPPRASAPAGRDVARGHWPGRVA